MSMVAIVSITILFCIIQILFLRKGKKKWIKYFPAVVCSISLMIVGFILTVEYNKNIIILIR